MRWLHHDYREETYDQLVKDGIIETRSQIKKSCKCFTINRENVTEKEKNDLYFFAYNEGKLYYEYRKHIEPITQSIQYRNVLHANFEYHSFWYIQEYIFYHIITEFYANFFPQKKFIIKPIDAWDYAFDIENNLEFFKKRWIKPTEICLKYLSKFIRWNSLYGIENPYRPYTNLVDAGFLPVNDNDQTWRLYNSEGKTLYKLNPVRGDMYEVVDFYPAKDTKEIYQSLTDYNAVVDGH
jgi:hypothetical protein